MPAAVGSVGFESVPTAASPHTERWREMDQRETGPFGSSHTDNLFDVVAAIDLIDSPLLGELPERDGSTTELSSIGQPMTSSSGPEQQAPLDARADSTRADSTGADSAGADSTGADESVIVGEEDGSDLLLRLGSATMLATGVMAGLAARRRQRLRASSTQTRPMPLDRLLRDEHLGTKNAVELQDLDSDEYHFGSDVDLSEFADDPSAMGLQMGESTHRMLRLDLVLRIVAVPLIRRDLAIAVVLMNDRGDIEIVTTGDVALERPFRGEGRRWLMSAQVSLDRLIEMAQGLDYPCPALVHLGNVADGRELYVDLEVIGVLSVIDDRRDADTVGRLVNGPVGDVLRAVKATLETSLFGHDLEQYWVGTESVAARIEIDGLGLQQVTNCEGFEELMGSISSSHSGKVRVAVVSAALSLADAPMELWAGGGASGEYSSATNSGTNSGINSETNFGTDSGAGEIVMVGRGAVPATGARLRAQGDHWILDGPVMEDLEFLLFPVGLSVVEAAALADLIEEETAQPVLTYEVQRDSALLEREDLPISHGDRSLVLPIESESVDSRINGESHEPQWALMVRVMGTVDVVDTSGTAARFDRSKSLELLAWCVTHRGRSTRSAARTAMWELNVRDATFANVVSEARRATAALVPPPKDRDWLHRTLTEELVLDHGVVSDAEIMRRTLDRVDQYGVAGVVTEVEAAVALIRGMPCEGSNFLWPEAEGISSDLILVATSLAASLAMHRLAEGDVQGVFRATAAGLLALPGHEELIALRMRAHGAAGDLAGVKQEWAAYQRVMARDPWSSGEPAPKLRDLSRELLGHVV